MKGAKSAQKALHWRGRLARAGKEEGVKKLTRLDLSFPNSGKSFLA